MIDYKNLVLPEKDAYDVFEAFLYYYKDNTIKANRVGLHRVFHRLFQEFPKVLSDFSFRVTCGKPWSLRLDEVVQTSIWSDVIRTVSFDYTHFLINRKTATNYLKSSADKFSLKEQEEIKSMAKRCFELLKGNKI